MRHTFAGIFSLTVLALAGAASADPEQTPGSNVSVTTCHAQLDKPQLTIGYKNLAPTQATEIDFAIVVAVGTVETVKDIGKFGNQTQIKHVFSLPADVSPLGLSSARCVVTKVVYADGTTWVNSSPAP
jgi:hypothetical protein